LFIDCRAYFDEFKYKLEGSLARDCEGVEERSGWNDGGLPGWMGNTEIIFAGLGGRSIWHFPSAVVLHIRYVTNPPKDLLYEQSRTILAFGAKIIAIEYSWRGASSIINR
jgi:hypothetical protein